MDLEIERSVEDNEFLETENLGKNGEIDAKLKDNGIKIEATMKKELSPSPSPATKGRGLKKWRRIRRESGKETNSNLDSNRKRGMTALPAGFKQKSEGSNSSTNAVSNIVGNNLDQIGLNIDLSSGKGPDFGSRADSDNSEDQNSRSSTAASAPRTNYNFPVINSGFDKNMVTNSGILVQNDQQEKSRNITKKARAVRNKKENSISSMESDSRSSNFVFVQGSTSMTSNGRSGKLGNYDEDDSDDVHNGEKHLNDEGRIESSKNEADSADVLHEDLAGENSREVKKDDKVNEYVESIIPLHLAQEALEREVQKLRNVGKDDDTSSLIDEEFQSNKNNEINLQNKLEEAYITLEHKNTKISRLESALNIKEIKTEHEELLKQRIAAELEYLVISETIQTLKTGAIGQTGQQKKMEFEDAWKLKNMVGKYAYYGVIQLVLFFGVLYMLVLKFSSNNGEVIPT